MLTVCELFQTFPCVYLIKWNNCIKGYDQSLRVFIRIVTFKAFYKNCHIGFQKCYMDRGAWWAAVHGVTKSRTWLKRPSRHAYIGDSDKEFACQWRRCRKCGFALWSGRFPWRRKWQPTPVFLPGKSRGQGAWQAAIHEVTEWDTTEHAHTQHLHNKNDCLWLVWAVCLLGFSLFIILLNWFLMFRKPQESLSLTNHPKTAPICPFSPIYLSQNPR